MCDCEDDEIEDDMRIVPLTPAMMRRMVAIEATLPGTRVPDRSWDVFLGRASGGVPFAQLARLQQCRQLIVDEEKRARHLFVRARSRRQVALQCVEVR